jgi:hypothetical protein
MQTLNRSVTPMSIAGQSPLPIDAKRYLREIAYVAMEAATSHDPRVMHLALKVLAMQAPRLEALAVRGAL